MALHFSDTKSFSRKEGKSAVASAAYRSGEKLFDERHNKTHNYTAKSKNGGVVDKKMLLPSKFSDQNITLDRATEWNKAEKAEKRKDARVAREWLINIPYELYEKDPQKAIETAFAFGQKLADRYNCMVDCCVHKPTAKDIEKGADPRNIHCHIMLTTREVEIENNEIKFTKKTVAELSDTDRRKLGLCRMSEEIPQVKELWDNTANPVLSAYDIEPMDWRSNKEKAKETGVDIMPQIKMGVSATAMERKGIATTKGDINRLIGERNELVFKRHLEHEIIVESRKQPEPQPTQATPEQPVVRLSLAEQRARNRARKGQDELTPEQRVAKAVTTAQQRHFDDDALRKLIETDTAKQATVSNEADQIKKQVDTLKNIVGIVTQQLYERYSQVQPSQLKTLAELHQNIIDGLDDMASREVILDFDSKVVEYSDSKNNLATIDQVTGRLAQLKAERERLEQAVSTAPEPPEPRPQPQAQAQPSDRAKLKAKLEEMQNKRLQETIEETRRLEQELERLNQREQPQTPPEREPQPQTPPQVERLEMVSIDPRLRYETRKGLEQIKAHIEAMPQGERQNKAIIEFNRVVSEQLEKKQSKGMDR